MRLTDVAGNLVLYNVGETEEKKQQWLVEEMDLGKTQHMDRLLHKMCKAKQGPLKVKLKYLMWKKIGSL